MSTSVYNEAKTTGELTKRVANVLTEQELMLTTAESCTGGNLAAALCAEENTAAFYGVGLSLGAPPMLYALILAAAGNIMMTLTHYATGTAPVIFNSNYVTLQEWWSIGAVMSVVNLVVWIGAGLIWWKFVGYY